MSQGTYAPHSNDEIAQMLDYIGVGSIEDLFESIPDSVMVKDGLNFARGISETDVYEFMSQLSKQNGSTDNLICFAGGGAYDHDIPFATRSLASRSEFVTAYTPYQPEVSQGVLQAIFEFQTLISRLVELPITNASLYDGASALVEAVNLSVAQTGKQNVLISKGVNPHWRQVVKTFSKGTGHNIVEADLIRGTTNWSQFTGEGAESFVQKDNEDIPGTVVVSYPNYFGVLEDIDEVRRWSKDIGALLVVVYDPVAMGLLRSPGSFGADLAVAEGQVFGTALSYGGPYLGLFSCRQELVRRLPGRLVGRTVDSAGKTAYVTTLRAREQDIRREKASSNVCTNQTLMAVACCIQMSWLGKSGLIELARRCAIATDYLRQKVLSLSGVNGSSDLDHFREFVIELPIDAEAVVERMACEGFLAGIPLGVTLQDESYSRSLLVSLTEKRTRSELDRYVETLEKVIS